MPKLLQINSCINWGSTGRIVEQITNIAKFHGWQTFVAYGNSMNPSQSKLIRIADKKTRCRAILESRLLDNAGLSCKKETFRFIDKIEGIKPDIIHLHNLHAYYINYQILFDFLNSTNIPIVWTLHDCWPFTGHCAHFISAKCEKWKSECHNCPLKSSYPSSWLIDKSQRNYRLKQSLFTANRNLHIVTVSKWMEQMVRESFLKEKDIRTIYNGIDTEIFSIDKPQSHDKIQLLGVASTWGAHKGYHDFIALRKLLPPEKYNMVLVGLTEKQIKSLPPGISGHRRTNSVNELCSFYNNADIVLSLSYGESMGLTPIEGMACGTPAIVYDNTAQPELISEETGLIVETGNIKSLIEAIETISSKGKDYYSKSCRERAVKLFDREERYEEYFRLYKSLL